MTRTAGSAASARGTLGIGPDGSFRIHFERRFQHSPQQIWQWLVDPEKLQRWLPGCTIAAHEGGAVLFDFGDEGQASGTVTSLQAPQDSTGHLEHTWEWEGAPTSSVTWQIVATEDGALLTLVHRELIEEPAREFAIGWHMILDALQLDISGSATDDAWNMSEETTAYYFNP